jgi:hypothetical protein
MTSKTTATVSALDTATAAHAALEEQHRTAQAEARTAQEYADALPGRLAAGDESVSTDDLIQAGPAAAVAQAKAQAVEHQLTAAREALVQAQADELAARLRAGEPFLHWDAMHAELEDIAAQAMVPLNALAERIDAHNTALWAITRATKRHYPHTYTTGDGQELRITHEDVELDGQRWSELSETYLSKLMVEKIDRARAQQRAAKYVPGERDLTEHEFLAQEQQRIAQQLHEREQAAQ